MREYRWPSDQIPQAGVLVQHLPPANERHERSLSQGVHSSARYKASRRVFTGLGVVVSSEKHVPERKVCSKVLVNVFRRFRVVDAMHLRVGDEPIERPEADTRIRVNEVNEELTNKNPRDYGRSRQLEHGQRQGNEQAFKENF